VSSNPKVHQIIDIVVVDIPEAYGLLLSRDWSTKLQGYFASDWSHLWFPWNGQSNKIRIDREHYMKHTVTDLETPNEPSNFDFPILGNYNFDSYFGNFVVEISPIPKNQFQEMFLKNHILIF
jgi:hypothetical protein